MFVHPTVRRAVTPSLRRVLGASYAVYPALFALNDNVLHDRILFINDTSFKIMRFSLMNCLLDGLFLFNDSSS